MHRFLSFVRHASRSSPASSLLSLLEAKHSVRSYGSLGSLRSHGSAESPCFYKCVSGLPQNDEHVRGFSSMNSGWNTMNEKFNASGGFNPGENVNASHGFDLGEDVNASRGFNPGEDVNASHGFNLGQNDNASHGFNLGENVDTSNSFNLDSRRNINPLSQNDSETQTSSTPMDFVRRIIETDGKGVMGGAELSRYNLEREHDFVHIKLLRNNTFVTVTDSKGNVKLKASSGCLKEMKGGQKLAKYAAEATAEEVGRRARRLGLKSVVMKVKGYTYFKKKRQAIVSWREGYTDSRADRNPIVYIEDSTRVPHNGCRLPKRRRI